MNKKILIIIGLLVLISLVSALYLVQNSKQKGVYIPAKVVPAETMGNYGNFGE